MFFFLRSVSNIGECSMRESYFQEIPRNLFENFTFFSSKIFTLLCRHGKMGGRTSGRFSWANKIRRLKTSHYCPPNDNWLKLHRASQLLIRIMSEHSDRAKVVTGSRTKKTTKTGRKSVGERDVWRDCASLVPPFVLLLLFNESRIYLNENRKQWATASR